MECGHHNLIRSTIVHTIVLDIDTHNLTGTRNRRQCCGAIDSCQRTRNSSIGRGVPIELTLHPRIHIVDRECRRDSIVLSRAGEYTTTNGAINGLRSPDNGITNTSNRIRGIRIRGPC